MILEDRKDLRAEKKSNIPGLLITAGQGRSFGREFHDIVLYKGMLLLDVLLAKNSVTETKAEEGRHYWS